MTLLSSLRHPRRSSSRSSHTSHTSHASDTFQAAQKRRYRIYSLVVAFLLFTVFLLLLLVSLSLPITKSIYLLSMHAAIDPDLGIGLPETSVATRLRFGVWGFCAFSSLRIPGIRANDDRCTTPALGYDLDPSILELTGHPELIEAILHGLTLVLVLHPVCAALAFITLFLALLSFLALTFSSRHHTRAHGLAITALVFAVLTALLTTLSAIIDIVLVAVARDRIGALTDFEFEVGWGNAVWMTLVGAILAWVVVVLLSAMVCGCCGVRWRPGGFRKRRVRKLEEAKGIDGPVTREKNLPETN